MDCPALTRQHATDGAADRVEVADQDALRRPVSASEELVVQLGSPGGSLQASLLHDSR